MHQAFPKLNYCNGNYVATAIAECNITLPIELIVSKIARENNMRMHCRAAIAFLIVFSPMHALAQETGPVFSFDHFPVANIFRGPNVFPKFRARDKPFSSYRTRVVDGMRQGPNLSGAYTLIEIGCGTSCRVAFIANNRTGEVFDFPRGGEGNYGLELAYTISSRLIVAQWEKVDEAKCILEFFKWDGRQAKLLKSEAIGTSSMKGEACDAPLSANFRG